MDIKTKGYWLGALLAATCVFSSCTKNDDANDENIVSNNYIVVQSTVNMSGNSQSTKIDLEANCQWKVSYDKGSWNDLVVTPSEGTGSTTVIIESSVNNTETDRYVDLKFSTIDGDLPRVCKVTQSAGDFVAELAFESLESNTVTVPYNGQEREFSVASNTSWDADIEFEGNDASNPWCYLINDEGNLNDRFSVIVIENQYNTVRRATVKVSTKNRSGEKKIITLVIEQNAAPVPTATIKATRASDAVTINIDGSVASGSIYDLTDYGYCISKSPNPRDKISKLSGESSKTASFTDTRTEEDGYTYYICAYATTIVGTTYSDDVEIQLPGNTPGNDDNVSPSLVRKK